MLTIQQVIEILKEFERKNNNNISSNEYYNNFINKQLNKK